MSRRALVNSEVLEAIRRVVLEEAGKLGVRVEKIILFGSRARGEAREDSDYDILIVVEGSIDWRVRRRLSLGVRRRLYRILRSPLDILVYTSGEFRERSRIGVAFEGVVAREGIVIE